MKIIETCLYANELNKAETFYSDILNFDLITKDPERHLFYRCGNNMLLIFNPRHTRSEQTEVNGNPVPLHGAEGPGHIAFSVDRRQYEDWKQRLSDHGINIESEIHWPGGIRSFYFRDPSGNSLEIIGGDMWKLS